MDNYIGLDAHSKTCTFINLSPEGEILNQGTFNTSERNLKEMVRSIKGKKALVFEETNIAQWLYVLLKGEVDEIISCHAAYLPKKSGPKNDYRDALHLALQLKADNLTPVFHEDSFLMNLRSLVSHYETINLQGARLKGDFKALLRSQGLVTQSSQKTVTNPDKWKEFKDPTKQFVAGKIYEQILSTEKTKQEFVNEFKRNLARHKVLKNLASIPGVGKVRAHIIAAYISCGHRFENKHKLWSYAKLVRHQDESDGYVLKHRTPHGRTELKAAFMGAAQRIVISPTHTALKDYYVRLKEEKGLDEKKARKALARKIAAICLVVMKKGIRYDDKKLKEALVL